MTLRFFEKTHKYTLDGKPIPGVTTLLGGGVPKPALPYWAAKSVAEYVADNLDEVNSLVASSTQSEVVSFLKGIPWKKRDEAAVRGTDVHALAEEIIHGREVDVPDSLLPFVEGYVRFLEEFDVQPVLTETRVANRTWWYAGSLDAVLTMGRGPWAGETICADWKTSRGVYGDTALQVAAYSNAEFCAGPDSTECPLPEISRIAVVHVTENGSLAYDLGDIDKAFAEFKSAAYIAKTADRRKALIGDPLTPEGLSA